jgi:hypothetical protein
MAAAKQLTVEEIELRTLMVDARLPALWRQFTSERNIYDHLMPERLLRFALTGKSKSAFAGEMLVSRQTLYNWREMYPDFRDAWEIFNSVRQNVLENQLLSSSKSGPIVARLRALSKIDKASWGDSKSVEVNPGVTPADREKDPEKAYLFMLNGEEADGGLSDD